MPGKPYVITHDDPGRRSSGSVITLSMESIAGRIVTCENEVVCFNGDIVYY